jgi:hypothetical protein
MPVDGVVRTAHYEGHQLTSAGRGVDPGSCRSGLSVAAKLRQANLKKAKPEVTRRAFAPLRQWQFALPIRQKILCNAARIYQVRKAAGCWPIPHGTTPFGVYGAAMLPAAVHTRLT